MVESGRDDRLIAALAGTVDDDVLPVPLGAGDEDVNRAHEPDEHAGEIALLTGIAALVTVILKGARGLFGIE